LTADVQESLSWENTHTFLTRKLIPAWHRLSTLNGLAAEERTMLLVFPSFLATLPDGDESVTAELEIDLYWGNKNWLGRMNISGGAVALWSCLLELSKGGDDYDAQWQHTALEIVPDQGITSHDPAHLWFWCECFGRFVDACFDPKDGVQGSMNLRVGFSNFFRVIDASGLHGDDQCE
jgi:hypothetical protein